MGADEIGACRYQILVKSEFDGLMFSAFAKAADIWANPDKSGEATNCVLSDVLTPI